MELICLLFVVITVTAVNSANVPLPKGKLEGDIRIVVLVYCNEFLRICFQNDTMVYDLEF